MKFAIVHYHLRPGGVTRVIEHAVTALAESGHTGVVLSGEIPRQALPFPVQVVPGLGYTSGREKVDPEELACELKRVASKALGGQPALWHIHNPSLGKNPALSQAVVQLAIERPVLLQIHDFAEDGRPGNYALLRSQLPSLDQLYPAGPHIHYAALNARDASVLRKAGLPEDKLHCLPNAISVPRVSKKTSALAPELEGRRLVLYPTRGIRRKNLGEWLLLATLADPDTHWASTLEPANPSARPIYDRWVAFARECSIPVSFGLGESSLSSSHLKIQEHSSSKAWNPGSSTASKPASSFQSSIDFGALMAAADSMVTTSVAEGFGLAFLEPCLFGKPLLGRNLPEVTVDFQASGISLNQLYNALPVPLDWVDEAQLRAKLKQALELSYESFGEPLPGHALERAWAAAVSKEGVDFGHLDEALQEVVIRRVLRDPGARRVLQSVLPPSLASQHVSQNRQAVLSHYSLQAYGARLAAIYDQVCSSDRGPMTHLSSNQVLHEFLKPERFCLLRT